MDAFAAQVAPQILPTAAIIVNGKPVVPNNDARLEFQKRWLALPQTLHQLSSFDTHIIPGTGAYVVTAMAKVKFDESGKSRLGGSGDLVVGDMVGKLGLMMLSFFGVSMTLVCDQGMMVNENAACILSLDYRITYKPSNSVIDM